MYPLIPGWGYFYLFDGVCVTTVIFAQAREGKGVAKHTWRHATWRDWVLHLATHEIAACYIQFAHGSRNVGAHFVWRVCAPWLWNPLKSTFFLGGQQLISWAQTHWLTRVRGWFSGANLCGIKLLLLRSDIWANRTISVLFCHIFKKYSPVTC